MLFCNFQARGCLPLIMVQNYKNLEDSFILNWNKEIHDLFIDELEKQHDLGKYSDIRFKSGA